MAFVAELPPYPGTPRWLKLSAIIVRTVTLLVIVVNVTGNGATFNAVIDSANFEMKRFTIAKVFTP